MTFSIEEPSIPELTDLGVLAFQNRDYKSAIKHLINVVDHEPHNWRAKLYLGMSYFFLEDVSLSMIQFRSIAQGCPEADTRQKAETAIAALNSKLRNQMPEMTCRMKMTSSGLVAQPIPNSTPVTKTSPQQTHVEEVYSSDLDTAELGKLEWKKR